MSSLPRSTPETQGTSTAALDRFVAALDASGAEIQTLMVLRHGHVVLEAAWSPYRLTDRHLLFSVSKSFTSMAVGLAVEAGLLSVEDKVVSFFSGDDLPEKISDNLAAMEVRHLLTMSTGHAEDTVGRLARDGRMTRDFLALEVEHPPGAPFVYNSGATYLLSAIVQKLTGQTVLEYLKPRLFEPLGATEAIWEKSAEGVSVGGWGLSLNTESLAKFGQLLLQGGSWEGDQVVPAAWVEAATAKQVDNSGESNVDWQQGYGYQFWRSRHNAYRGDGAFGQYVVVLPDQDAVLVITSASPDMQAVLNLVWEHLLPAFDAPAGPSESGGERKLEIPAPTGTAPRPGDGRTYRFPRNDLGLRAVRLDPDGTGTFTLNSADRGLPEREQSVVCAPGGWAEQVNTTDDPPQRMVTTAYGDGDAFVGVIRLLETPFVITLTCHPTDNHLTVDLDFNVGFDQTHQTLESE